MKHYRYCLVVLLGLLVSGLAVAQEYPRPLAQLELNQDDVMVFLGDSITHQCLYTQYLEDYFYTRYPQRRIRFHNAGVGGDVAADALVRFAEDVASFKPKYVSVLLGMNDGRYRHFDPEVFQMYERDMTNLIEQIAACGAKAILIGPTMFDMRARRIRARAAGQDEESLRQFLYYNDVLAFYGAYLREQAFSRGLGFVDMYSPLNNITLAQRKSDPQFTLIADAVHPGGPGQLVMAYALLDMMDVSRQVSRIDIYRDEWGEWQTESDGGALLEPQRESETSGRFTFIPEGLPWVVPDEAQAGYDLVQAGNNLSREVLRISGIQPGRYEIAINQQVIGRYTDRELAAGIELQGNKLTPQYQQALKVALLNKERNDKAVRPLRNLWGQMKGKIHSGLAKDKPEEFTAWQTEFRQKVADLQAQAGQYEDRIYQINKPQTLEYVIHRVD
ncbi:MAG: SGNH/GDSL hydrolase family protein [Sedimentisphaerales bacterium]|nr:SGNH/GDSL hydrolase family protein [Sedimentisphaerales bacterium]